MGLFSLESSAGDAAELSAAEARCYLALGRLDGAVTHATPDVLAQFALLLVRRSLAQALTAAGYLFTDAAFEAWITRAGGPPPGGPGTAAPAPAIAAALFADLRASKWPPLANAAARVWRAAPHLGRGNHQDATAVEDRDGDEEWGEERGQGQSEGQGERSPADLEAVVELGRALLRGGDGDAAPADVAPLAVLAGRLARAPAAFVPIERGAAVLETDTGPLAVPMATQRAHDWALGPGLGEMFVDQGVLRWPLPFVGAIAPEIMRRDCEADVRQLRLAEDVAQAALDLLRDLDTARRLVARAKAALADARSTSRAPAVFALIAGLGAVTRSQVAEAFEMTARRRRPGRAGGFCVAKDAALALRGSGPGADALSPTGIGDLDAAMADLDRLLAGTSS